MKRWRATIPVRRSFFYSTCQVVRRCLFLISFRFTVVIRDKSWSETDGECVLFTFSRHLSKQGPERGFSPPPPIHRNKIQSNNVNNLRKLFPPYYRVLVSNSTRSQIHNRISVWSGWNRYHERLLRRVCAFQRTARRRNTTHRVLNGSRCGHCLFICAFRDSEQRRIAAVHGAISLGFQKNHIKKSGQDKIATV